MRKKLLFIINPISGHHNKNNFPKLVDEEFKLNTELSLNFPQ